MLHTFFLLCLENGVTTTPKRRLLTLIFTCLCFKKLLLIKTKRIFTLFFLSQVSPGNVSVNLKGEANIPTYDASLHAVDQTVKILRQNKQIHHGLLNVCFNFHSGNCFYYSRNFNCLISKKEIELPRYRTDDFFLGYAVQFGISSA